MAHTPLKMTIDEAHAEVNHGWEQAYSPEALAQAVESLSDQPLGYRVNIFLARICFRGIYFPMMGKMAWVKVIAQNRKTIFKLVREGFKPNAWRGAPARVPAVPVRTDRKPESGEGKVAQGSQTESHRLPDYLAGCPSLQSLCLRYPEFARWWPFPLHAGSRASPAVSLHWL